MGGICSGNSNSIGASRRGVIGDLYRADFQGLRINAQMHLAPLALVLGAMFFTLPFAFTQHLDAGTIEEHMHGSRAWLVRKIHDQRFLKAAHGTVIGRRPIQLRQLQQAFTMPMLWRRGKLNRTLVLRQNWMAA